MFIQIKIFVIHVFQSLKLTLNILFFPHISSILCCDFAPLNVKALIVDLVFMITFVFMIINNLFLITTKLISLSLNQQVTT